MSFRKYGGTNKLEKNNNITVHSIVADTFTIRDAFLSVFTIDGDLTIGGNADISNNLTVSKQINVASLDVSLNAMVGGNFYFDKSKDVFLKGDNQMIGLNKTIPTATLDISSNRVEAFNLKTSTTNNRNIIARNSTNNGIAVIVNGTDESGIQFYSANTGTIDVSNAQGALIKYSKLDSVLSIDSIRDVKVLSQMMISDNPTSSNTHTTFGETLLIYDKDYGPSQQPVFFPEAYGDSNVKTGSALTIQSINNVSNTFMNIVDPNKHGIQIGGGSYPKDPTRSMGVIDVYNTAIDVDATPSMMFVSGNGFVKFNSTTGFNTFQPKYEDYAVDINGPVHVNNGEIKKTQTTTNRIAKMSSYGTTYGIAIGGQTQSSDGSQPKHYPYTTTDGGRNWSRKNPLNAGDTYIYADITFTSIYSYNSSRTIVGGASSLSWVTDDGGSTWSQLTSDINIMTAIYIPRDASSNFIYIGGKNDNGDTVIQYGSIVKGQEVSSGGFLVDRYSFPISNTVDVNTSFNVSNATISGVGGYGRNLFFVGGNVIYKYDISQNKMELIPKSATAHPSSDVSYNAVKFVDINNGVAVGRNVLSYTRNGTTWTSVTSPDMTNKTFNDVYLDSSMNAIVVGNNGIIYSSNDNYTTWKIVGEDVLNASGIGARIIDTNNDITSVFMTDSSTIVLSIVKNNDNGAEVSKLYYLNMPNIFNNKQNFLLDISGCIRMSGDLNIFDGGAIKSKNQTFNLVTTDVITMNAATNAQYINIGGANTINVAVGGTTTNNLTMGGANVTIGKDVLGNIIVGGDRSESKFGSLNVSSLSVGNVTLSNNLKTGNIYANSIVVTNNLDVSNGILTVRNTTNSTSETTGALVVAGGLSVAKDIHSTGNINSLSDINLSGNLYSSGNVLVMTSDDNVSAITSGNIIIYTSNTGTLQIGGGTAISKNIYIGGTTFCGGDLVIQGQITYLGGEVSTSTTFSSAIAASPLRGNSNSNVNYNYTYRPRDPPTDYNDIGFGAGALTTEGGFAVALDSWMIGSLRVDGSNNKINGLIESSSTGTGVLTIAGGVGIGKNINIGGNAIIYSSIESSGTATGALQVRGGAGIGGNIFTGGNVYINSSLETSSTNTGALQVRGGVGIGGNIFTGGNIYINSSRETSSTNTGALQVRGGAGIGGNIFTGGNIIINSTTATTDTVTGALQVRGGAGIGGNIFTGGNIIVNNTAATTDTATGALQIRDRKSVV